MAALIKALIKDLQAAKDQFEQLGLGEALNVKDEQIDDAPDKRLSEVYLAHDRAALQIHPHVLGIQLPGIQQVRLFQGSISEHQANLEVSSVLQGRL